MPASKYLDKKSVDTKLIVTKVGTKFIYAVKEGTQSEYKFTPESDSILTLVNNMVSSKAYSEDAWGRQKLIIELNQLTQEFKIKFLQINSCTDFMKYENMVSRMKEISEMIIEKS